MIPKPEKTRNVNVHATALIADGAELGEGVEIGAYCAIGPGVRIGPGCRLHSHVVIQGDTVLGADCEVFPFAVLGTKPQDKKLARTMTLGILRIGDDNTIREHVTIHGGTPHGRGMTTIGNRNMLLAACHIGHDSSIGSDVTFTNAAMVAGHTWIGDRAVLGAMVGIHQFARVGELAMIGGGGMLSRDAPPFALVQGDRARLVGVNLVGMKRAGMGSEDFAAVKRAYRMLFWHNGKLTERMDSVRNSELASNPLVQRVLVFITDSHRGVCMPRYGRSFHGRDTGDIAEI